MFGKLRIMVKFNTVRLQLQFICDNNWAAWDLMSLSQLHHVNTYIESHTTHLLR